MVELGNDIVKKKQIKLILHSDMLAFLYKKQEKKKAFKAKLKWKTDREISFCWSQLEKLKYL